MRRLRIGLILSLGLHAALATWLWRRELETAKSDVITIDLTSSRPESSSKTPSQTKVARKKNPAAPKSARSRTATASAPTAKDLLGWKDDWMDRSIRESALEENSPERTAIEERKMVSDGWTDSWSYQPGTSFHERFSWTDRHVDEFFGALRERIENNLAGHPMLADFNHTGTVFLKFAVDRSGRLIADSLSARAADGILKVYSARALRKGLATGLREDLHLDREGEIWLSARFEWIASDLCRPHAPRAGPFFTFCRESYEGREKTDTASRIMTEAVAISGMIINPDEIGERLKARRNARFRQAAGFDPFVRERQDPDYNL